MITLLYRIILLMISVRRKYLSFKISICFSLSLITCEREMTIKVAILKVNIYKLATFTRQRLQMLKGVATDRSHGNMWTTLKIFNCSYNHLSKA